MRIFLLLSLITIKGFAQTSYTGFIDRYPIQLVTYIYSDGDARAIYAYNNFDTPIVINGKSIKGKLELYERDDKESIKARLVFNAFDAKSLDISGEWINMDSTKRLKISLTKEFDINYEDKTTWKNREIIQSESTETNYFKLQISKRTPDQSARVTGVKIFEKKTDRLIQQINLSCQLNGLDNIKIGDYNFDGFMDFSVFEGSYVGTNTSSIYILKIPSSEKYFVSSFSGTSLVFDSESKTIHEHNVCCQGRSIMNASYKIKDNKMVLIERVCLEYDDKKDDFVKKNCD